MSKSEGLKIGIKFNEDLAGDVNENKSAFTITGKEYKYVNGSLLDKTYIVDKVERYPVDRIITVNLEEGDLTQLQITSNGLTLGVV